MSPMATPSKGTNQKAMAAPQRMKLLFTVVNREKTEFYVDLLHNFEVNMQLVLAGSGTADAAIHTMMGVIAKEKSVIISFLREDRAKEALAIFYAEI